MASRRDGHEGWSRSYEDAWERVFGSGAYPPPADFTLVPTKTPRKNSIPRHHGQDVGP